MTCLTKGEESLLTFLIIDSVIFTYYVAVTDTENRVR